MKIKVYMLTGQNNGEKDVLRAYYRGLVTHFSQSVKVKEELTEFNMQKYIMKAILQMVNCLAPTLKQSMRNVEHMTPEKNKEVDMAQCQ